MVDLRCWFQIGETTANSKSPLKMTNQTNESTLSSKSSKFEAKNNQRIMSIKEEAITAALNARSMNSRRGIYRDRNNNKSHSAQNYPTIVISIIIYLSITQLSHEQTLCPKSCTCDEQNLEVLCKESIGASGLPHTLNPNTKRMVINNAQTSQFSGLDYLVELETIDLSYNRISSIDFRDITKNIHLISLNTSHNNLTELKDTLVSSILADLGISTSNPLQYESADLRTLKSSKINVIELILNNNYLTTIRSLTFIRWHKLKTLDLSYNSISNLEDQSLYGLSKLEIINLRGNRLTQVPTLALHSSIYSFISQANPIPPRPSSLKFIDLSENTFETIGPDSFSLLEKAQELYLESCTIQSIHERAFKGLHTLYLLSLDANNLSEVPSRSFGYLGLLRLLKLNANKITDLPPGVFTSLVNLEELQINNGSFRELTNGVLNGIDSLKRLEVAYNSNLTRIERGTFENVPRLTYLSLYANSLPTLPDNLNDITPSLNILDLRGNPLHCGCDMKWLTKWLKRFNEKAAVLKLDATTVTSNNHNTYDDTQILLMDSSLTRELGNLTCSGPPALAGRQIIELPDNKLECLEPSSDLNVHLGFAALFSITTAMAFVCLLNFCRNKKHIFVMLKENLVQNQMSMMSPYPQNADFSKKETQLYCSDYEHIDYNQHHQPQIYTIHGG